MVDDDALLVRKYLDGDKGAFETLYRRYQMPLFNYLYRSCLSTAVAEDIFQEVFLQVIKKMPKYCETQNFKAWIYTIARNKLIDKGRLKANLDVAISDGWEYGDLKNNPETIAESNEKKQILHNAINALPVQLRELLMMRHFSGLSFKEIAETTSTPIGTVLSRVHRGLEYLREKIL